MDFLAYTYFDCECLNENESHSIVEIIGTATTESSSEIR